MPDLRSELEKVIHAWEQPEQPETQPEPQPEAAPTMNTTTTPIPYNEALFNFVKANPGLTGVQIESHVPQIPKGSVTSLLAAMAKRHLIIKSGGSGSNHYGGVYHAAVDKYMSPAEQLGMGRGKRISSAKKKIKLKRTTAKPQRDQLDMFTLDTSERKVPPAPKPELTVSSPAPAPQPIMRSVFDLDIESLTIAEARALRDKLNALFSA